MEEYFNTIPELFNCKIANIKKIDYVHGTLLLSRNIFNALTYKQKFVLWILEKNFINFEYTNIDSVYKKSLNEWIKYNKNKNEFIALVMTLIITYGKNSLTKTKHLDIIRLL